MILTEVSRRALGPSPAPLSAVKNSAGETVAVVEVPGAEKRP
jgi:hypothetical protein